MLWVIRMKKISLFMFFLLVFAGVAQARFLSGGSPISHTIPSNAYVKEDRTTAYVAEDRTTYYVQE